MNALHFSRQPLYLANVHLEAGADKGVTRLTQLRSLLRRIELQCAVDAAAGNGRPQVRAQNPQLVAT